MTIASKITGRESDVLDAIGKGAFDIDRIAMATRMSRPRIKGILTTLFEKRLVIRAQPGVYEVRDGYAPRSRSEKPSTLEPSSIPPIPLSRLMAGRA